MKSTSTILALDTSTSITSAALRLGNGETLIEEFSLGNEHVPAENKSRASHNEELQGVLTRLLDKAAIKSDKIDSLVVGAGPGSFTGLRIGFSLMKGLSFAAKIPLYTVSSLAGLAFDEGPDKGLLIPISDARRGQVFSAIFKKQDSGVNRRLTSDAIQNIDELVLALGRELNSLAIGERRVTIITDSAANQSADFVAEIRNAALGLAEQISHFEFRAPSKIALGLIVSASGEGVADKREFSLTELSAAAPNYLRSVAARTIAERLGASGGGLK